MTENEEFVLAITSNLGVRKYDKLGHVEAGLRIMLSPDELIEELSNDELLLIYSNILKVPLSSQELTKEQLAYRIWLCAGSMESFVHEPEKPLPVKGPKGPRVRGELYYYLEFDPENPKHYAVFQDLPLQARTCVEIFHGSGTREMPEPELRRLIEESTALKTAQGKWHIFQYYRPRLIRLGLLRWSK